MKRLPALLLAAALSATALVAMPQVLAQESGPVTICTDTIEYSRVRANGDINPDSRVVNVNVERTYVAEDGTGVRFVHTGQPDCLPPTTTTVAPTTTTTAPPTTTTAPPTTTTTAPPPPSGFSVDFADPSSMALFDTVTWHRDPYLGGGTVEGDHSVAPGSDPNACTNPFVTRTLPHYGPGLISYDTEHVYRCAPGDNTAAAHMMVAGGEQSGYDFSAAWTSDTFENATTVSWDQNVTDLGGRNWSEVKLVPSRTWNPVQPPCGVTWVQCFTAAAGGTNGIVRSAADMDALIVSWFNVVPTLVTPIGEVSETWLFRDDWAGSAYNAMEANEQAFSSPAPRFTHTLTDNGDGTVTLSIDTRTVEYGVLDITAPGAFPNEPFHLVFSNHDYTSTKNVPAFNGTTWHFDNIEVN